MADDCLFCRIVRGEIPAKIVKETPECVAFRDINPQAPVHVLVIPREHVESLNTTRDAAMVGRLALVAAEIAKTEGIADTGCSMQTVHLSCIKISIISKQIEPTFHLSLFT